MIFPSPLELPLLKIFRSVLSFSFNQIVYNEKTIPFLQKFTVFLFSAKISGDITIRLK